MNMEYMVCGNACIFFFHYGKLAEAELATRLPRSMRYTEQACRMFRAESRRKEWLATRVLLHSVLGETANIVYEASGRPCLEDRQCEISISHSRGLAAMAFAPQRVGLDIERLSPTPLKLASKYLSESELPLLQTAPAETMACCLWSAKEAAYKLSSEQDEDFCNGICLSRCDTTFPYLGERKNFCGESFDFYGEKNFFRRGISADLHTAVASDGPTFSAHLTKENRKAWIFTQMLSGYSCAVAVYD